MRIWLNASLYRSTGLSRSLSGLKAIASLTKLCPTIATSSMDCVRPVAKWQGSKEYIGKDYNIRSSQHFRPFSFPKKSLASSSFSNHLAYKSFFPLVFSSKRHDIYFTLIFFIQFSPHSFHHHHDMICNVHLSFLYPATSRLRKHPQ